MNLGLIISLNINMWDHTPLEFPFLHLGETAGAPLLRLGETADTTLLHLGETAIYFIESWWSEGVGVGEGVDCITIILVSPLALNWFCNA